MKTPLLSLILAFLLCLGCKKSDNTSPSEKLYQVNFSVSDMAAVTRPYSKSEAATTDVGDTLKNHASSLGYYVYKADGSFIRHYTQTSDQADFGTIIDNLKPGSYTAVLIAYNANHNINAYSYPLSQLAVSSNTHWENTYSKRVDFKIETSNLDQSVKLDRIGGAIEVTLEDVIPERAAKIVLEVTDDVWIYYPASTTHRYIVKTKPFVLSAASKGRRNTKYFMNICNTFKPFSLKIKSIDASDVIIAEKTVNNLMCYQNRVTVLTGTLFPASMATSGFLVSKASFQIK